MFEYCVKKYIVIDESINTVLETESFYRAISYAKGHGLMVIDQESNEPIYDGLNDSLLV